jgi:hypothetical protein
MFEDWIKITFHQITEEQKKRAKICFECPFRELDRCKKCGCLVINKVRSSQCPIKKFESS